MAINIGVIIAEAQDNARKNHKGNTVATTGKGVVVAESARNAMLNSQSDVG